MGTRIAAGGELRGWGCRRSIPWLLFVVILAALFGLPRLAEAVSRRFLVHSCGSDHCFRNAAKEGVRIKPGLAYWITSTTEMGDGRVQQKFIDEHGKIIVALYQRGGTDIFWFYDFHHWIDGWDSEGKKPSFTIFSTTFPLPLYRGFISLLAAGFPWVQLLGGGLLFGVYWLIKQGRGVLNRPKGDEAEWGIVIAGAVLLFLGAMPGAAYNDVVTSFEKVAAYIQTRQLPNGTYLPLELRRVEISTFGYSWRTVIYALALVVGGGIIVAWFVGNVRALVAGIYFVCVPHPAAGPINEALRSGPLNPVGPEAVDAIRRDLAIEEPPSELASRTMEKRASALAERLRANRKLVEEIGDHHRSVAEAKFWQKEAGSHDRKR